VVLYSQAFNTLQWGKPHLEEGLHNLKRCLKDHMKCFEISAFVLNFYVRPMRLYYK